MEQVKQLSPEQVKALREPLPAEAVSQHPTKAYLSTIKVIYIVERLNDVFGIQGWFVDDQFVEKEGKMVVVRSTLTIPEYGICKSAFGGNDNSDLGDAYKGACTDALSKIASYLYIGMDVYKGLAGEKKPAPKAKAAEKKTESQKPEASVTDRITGKVGSDIKQSDKGTWIKVGDKPVHLWDFEKHIRGNHITAGREVEFEVLPKQGAKGQYFELVKVLAVVPQTA